MIKLTLGGSPCTHWSIAQTKNRETEPSGIGWELFKNYLIGLEKYNPDYFLYENNKSMAPAIREQITKELGVEPILINSALVSAQNRQRLYWTNIPGVTQPEDRGILLRDVLESGVVWNEKSYCLTTRCQGAIPENTIARHQHQMAAEPVNMTADGKAQCLRATCYKDGIRNMVGNTIDRKTCVAVPLPFGCNSEGKAHCLDANYWKGSLPESTLEKHRRSLVAEPVRIGTIESNAKNADFDSQQYRVYSPDGKSVTLCGNGGGVGAKTGLYAVPTDCDVVITENSIRCARRDAKHSTVQGSHVSFLDSKSKVMSPSHVPQVIESWDGKTYPVYEVRNGLITIKDKQYPIKLPDGFYIIRKLTVTECKRLQTVPDSYIFPVSNSQAYKMLGNGWTVDVIAHILSHAPGITTEPVEVLSMYDGMSCGHIAMDKLGANVVRYMATEIDKYAIKTTMANYPDTVHLGDAFQVRDEGWRANHE